MYAFHVIEMLMQKCLNVSLRQAGMIMPVLVITPLTHLSYWHTYEVLVNASGQSPY